jgi:ribosomal protein L37AE/L43A
MVKTGEFKALKSKCDFCGKPAVTVNEHGVAVCVECGKTKQLQKQAHLLDWEQPHDFANVH